MTQDLRIGVIGLGFGANHARVLSAMPGICLAAVADRDPTRLAAFLGSAVHSYEDHSAMLASERLDAAIVAVPASLHVEVALDAIAAGCAVLVEKPLAPSLEAALRIVEAARQRGVVLMPGHIERFNPAVIEAACRVRNGAIGRVLHVSARRMSATRAGEHGNRLPPTDVNVVHDSAIHDIDAIRYILGLEVETVSAVSQAGIVTPAEDSISGHLRFSAADAAAGPPPVASLDVSWLSYQRLRDLTIVGERGSLLVDYAAQTLVLRTSTEGPSLELEIQRHDQLMAELGAFVAVVRDGAVPPVTAKDGLVAVAVSDALTRSARTGLPVAVEDAVL